MPQTVPSNDLIPDYLNKPGRFFNTELKTKWFAESAKALWGRLVGGTYSINCFDLWIGNGGSPLQIIDSSGKIDVASLEAATQPDRHIPVITSEIFGLASIDTLAVGLQAVTPGTKQTGHFNLDGTGIVKTLRVGDQTLGVSGEIEFWDVAADEIYKLLLDITASADFHILASGGDTTNGPWARMTGRGFVARDPVAPYETNAFEVYDAVGQVLSITYTGLISTDGAVDAAGGIRVGTGTNRPYLRLDPSGATIGGLALANWDDPDVSPYVPVISGGLWIFDDPVTFTQPVQVVDIDGRVYIEGRYGEGAGFSPRFEIDKDLVDGQVRLWDPLAGGGTGRPACFVAGQLKLLSPEAVPTVLTDIAIWDATLNEGVVSTKNLQIASGGQRVLWVGGRSSTSAIAPGTAAAAFPEAGAAGFYIDTTGNNVHLVFNWDGVDRYSVQLTPIV